MITLIAGILCIATLYCGFTAATTANITKKILSQYAILWLDTAWIIFSLYTKSYFWFGFWTVFLILDYRTYQKWNNEQEEDKGEL